MTYKAIFTDEFLSYFRLDDNGKTLVLTDITGLTRAVSLEEVKHGEWIPCDRNGLILDEFTRRQGVKFYGYKCSNCNYIYHGNALIECPFCQKCGAEIRERKDTE